MKEKWIKWEPVNGLATRYYLESLQSNPEELKIVLFDEKAPNPTIQITFDSSVLAYRRTNESFTINTVSSFFKSYDQKLHGDWTLFKIDNSSYKSLLLEQATDKTDLLGATHFCFFTLLDQYCQ